MPDSYYGGSEQQPDGMRSGFYYMAPSGSYASTVAGVNSQLFVVPFWPGAAKTLDRIGVNVTGAGEAGSLLRLGVFASDTDGLPSTLLLDAGTVVGDGATGFKQITIALAVAASKLWLGCAFQSAVTTRPTVSAALGNPPGVSRISTPSLISEITGYLYSPVAGALTSLAVPSAVSTACPYVFVRAV